MHFKILCEFYKNFHVNIYPELNISPKFSARVNCVIKVPRFPLLQCHWRLHFLVKLGPKGTQYLPKGPWRLRAYL